jgi:RNA polymerase sigma-70 factor, ECF subfamily
LAGATLESTHAYNPKELRKVSETGLSTCEQKPASQAADADIHAHLRAGRHRAAFEAVLPRYRERVFRLAVSILRDSASAEDAAQDVFVRLWRALPGYNGNAALSTWIYAITRNTCISLLRKRRPQVSLDEPFGDDEDGAGLQLAAPEQDDSAVVSVEKLLGQLPERYRQAVTLFYMEDQSYEQTASALGLPLGTVKALLHRARKRLIELTGEAA